MFTLRPQSRQTKSTVGRVFEDEVLRHGAQHIGEDQAEPGSAEDQPGQPRGIEGMRLEDVPAGQRPIRRSS